MNEIAKVIVNALLILGLIYLNIWLAVIGHKLVHEFGHWFPWGAV